MIRILYVTDSLMAGGIESQLVELVTRLDRAHFDLHILCLYGGRTRGLHFAQQIQDAAIPLRVLDIGWGAHDKVRALGGIVATVRKLQPDIVQAEGYHANLLTRLARPLFPRGTPLVGTVRGVETPKQLRYERLSWRLCAHLVASGPHLKDALVRSADVPGSRIAVIPNSIDGARFASPASGSAGAHTFSAPALHLLENLRRQLAPGGERVLISVGRISKQKRMHLIAEAIGILKREGQLPAKMRICILGQTEHPAMQAKLDETVRRDGLESIVIQHPPTQYPEAYYWLADATILFTQLEGISIAMLESLAAGRPIIISEEANAAGVITDGRTGWIVRTGDVTHLADTIERVATLSDGALERMRAACVECAANYAINCLIDRYMALYKELAPPASVPHY
jgi:glycosyltransferase involved in cell wall biosynthesis